MNGHLLDTHVLLMWLGSPERLPPAVREVVRDQANPVFVSAAAVWEMAIKRALGRLDFPGNLAEILHRESIGVLDVDLRHALAVAELPLLHADPFDRMQIAQARIEGLTFVTGDRRIRAYDVEVLPA